MIAFIEWNVKPQIFDFGFFEIRWYSLLFLLGFIAGYYILSKIFKKEGLSIDLLDLCGIKHHYRSTIGALPFL
jgi:prolipoprotein diacylglyceryltransferase